jgi:Holliday junction resolvase-like predicted endonuclease
MSIKKISNKSLGQKGELVVQKILRDKGFEIIDTNVQMGNIGEIDIIGHKDQIYRFIEVKTISCYSKKEVGDLPFYNIGKKKQNTLARLAVLWMGKRKLQDLYQLDAVAVIYVKESNTWMYKLIENISW